MTHRLRSTVAGVALAAIVLAAAGPAAAQATIYRCGNEYTRVPCRDGKAVDALDPSTSAADRAAAKAAAARDRRQGDAMQRDRLRREAATPAAATSLGPAKSAPPAQAASASLKPPKKARAKIRVVQAEDFTAQVPKAKKPKTAPATAPQP